jgi:hypothetical protein
VLWLAGIAVLIALLAALGGFKRPLLIVAIVVLVVAFAAGSLLVWRK